MSTYTAVDISQLPYPNIVEELSYETIYGEMRAQMSALQPILFKDSGQAIVKKSELITEDNGDQYFRVPYDGESKILNLELESDPSARQLQVVAYREMLMRQRVNTACKGVMLAYAEQSDLEQLGVPFGITRWTITEEDLQNKIEAVYENDESLRRRIQLAMEGFSTAGPEAAYIFHALNAHADIKDAAAQSPTFTPAIISQQVRDTLPANAIVLIVNDDVGLTNPMPGDVAVTVLSHAGNGTASTDIQNAVAITLNEEDVRPVTDHVRERSADVQEYLIDATLYTYAGPDSSVVINNAKTALQAYVNANHKLGRDITLSGIYGALHQAGVQRVELNNFSQDIICHRHQAAYCTGITISDGGVAE
ncbi:baseplate assembly protein [Pseudomonas sp. HK3]